MPELPEVETIRRQLAPLVEGRRLLRVEILDPRWSRPLAPRELADALTGRRVERLGRRGKYLLWELSGGAFLAQHLRMTAAILCAPKPEPAHVRVRIALGKRGGVTDRRGLRLVIVDPRRFGTAELLLGEDALEGFFAARLGVEPLDAACTAVHLRELARGRRAPVKAFLLDQRRIAGVGNIYADEALVRAGLHPLRPAGKLSLAQWERLREGVIEALREGIDARGASIDDFRHIDGVRGSFQDRFLVHRRAGLPCPRCGTTIVKLVVAGRGTYVCKRCQPLARDRPAPARNQSASARNRPAPARNQAAPARNRPAPARDQAAPARNQAELARDQAEPARDQAAPARNQAASSSSSRPLSAAARTSSKPPTRRPSTST